MIYPISEAIDRLLDSAVDEETGELKFSDEELEAQIEELQMSFDEKVDSLCCVAKNSKAMAADIKDEKMTLAKRQKREENASERAKRFLAYLLKGEKFKNARHNLYYLTSQQLVVDDEEELIAWCKINAPGFLNEPTLREADIKQALKNGSNIPFAHLQENKNVVVK